MEILTLGVRINLLWVLVHLKLFMVVGFGSSKPYLESKPFYIWKCCHISIGVRECLVVREW